MTTLKDFQIKKRIMKVLSKNGKIGYAYCIVWSWHEDYVPYCLFHEQGFSDEEWRSILSDALKVAVERLMEEGFVGMDELVALAVEILKNRYGFEDLCFRQLTTFWGSVIIDKHDVRDLKPFLNEAEIKRMLKHNAERDK